MHAPYFNYGLFGIYIQIIWRFDRQASHTFVLVNDDMWLDYVQAYKHLRLDMFFSNVVYYPITFPHIDRLPKFVPSITNASFNNSNRYAMLFVQSDLRKSVIITLWPGIIIWQLQFGSTLTQVCTCCLTAPSHRLYQCWLFNKEVLLYSPAEQFQSKSPCYYSA